MKLRHATALALVGWYLIGPPLSKLTVEPSTPLSAWRILHTFDSAADCEKALPEYRRFMEFGIIHSSEAAADAAHQVASALMCIASDNPRLKERKP
jgi:hypothetical protein